MAGLCCLVKKHYGARGSHGLAVARELLPVGGAGPSGGVFMGVLIRAPCRVEWGAWFDARGSGLGMTWSSLVGGVASAVGWGWRGARCGGGGLPALRAQCGAALTYFGLASGSAVTAQCGARFIWLAVWVAAVAQCGAVFSLVWQAGRRPSLAGCVPLKIFIAIEMAFCCFLGFLFLVRVCLAGVFVFR